MIRSWSPTSVASLSTVSRAIAREPLEHAEHARRVGPRASHDLARRRKASAVDGFAAPLLLSSIGWHRDPSW
jgi:hypothetical protein